MPVQVIMPQLGESVVEGTISKWLKSKGDRIEEFEPLLEVNTDKVDSEIPSPASGILLDILVLEGTTVTAGTLLAWIGEPGETPTEILSEPPKPETSAGIPPKTSIELPEPVQSPPVPGRDQGLGFISPVVARIAAEEGVNLSRVRGLVSLGELPRKIFWHTLNNARIFPQSLGCLPLWGLCHPRKLPKRLKNPQKPWKSSPVKSCPLTRFAGRSPITWS